MDNTNASREYTAEHRMTAPAAEEDNEAKNLEHVGISDVDEDLTRTVSYNFFGKTFENITSGISKSIRLIKNTIFAIGGTFLFIVFDFSVHVHIY